MKFPIDESHYKLIIDAATDAIISKTLDGIVTSWNKGAERLFGYSAEEMIGQPLLKIFPPDRVYEESQILADIADGKTVEHFKTVRMHQQGYPIHISANISPIFDDNGKVIGVSKIARDITKQVELEEKSKLLEAIVAYSDDAIVSKTLDGIVTSWNNGAERIFGYPANEIIGQSVLILFPEDRKEEEAFLISEITAGKSVNHFQTIRLRKDGEKVPVSVSLSPIKNKQGDVVGVSKIARDISSQIELEQKNAHFQSLIDCSEDAIISCDLDGVITGWNSGAEALFGERARKMIGRSMDRFVPSKYEDEERYLIAQITSGKKVEHFLTERVNAQGDTMSMSLAVSPIVDITGEIIGSSTVYHDVTAQTQAQCTLQKLSEIDLLTQLYNRHAFVAKLREHIAQVPLNQKSAVIYLDLDRFKDINDKQGHEFGDNVLCHVAHTLVATLDDSAVLCRIGSDEFLIMLPDCREREAEIMAQTVLNELHKPFEVNSVVNVLSASIGVAIYPEHGRDPKALITNADHALVHSKNIGRNAYTIYNKELAKALSRNQLISVELPKAVVTGQLYMNYQPIIHMKSEQVSKAEALIRWNHPQLGFVSPAEFIPVAEENGCINDIGQWVFGQVVTQLGEWTKRYSDDFKVSINKSPVQFHTDDHAPQTWRKALVEQGLKCENLVVEITEGSLMLSTSVSESKLKDFSALGFELAIDDFGTGYSSLAYINKFHIDYVKIDRSFVSKIETHPDQLNICEGIILLAHKLGLKVIAEGIETEAQHKLLKDMGCDYGQGYWYCRPVSAQAFDEFMQRVLKEPIKEPTEMQASKKKVATIEQKSFKR
ncbi:EAL and GGDEF domain-containing protein [Pseudoalteromonas sp. SSDWG2]|uniref:sensor domain-containing protein n=1 Tax=Pseudoalteromonas sp. SSDWG2 TaxID=3139391 RepID=UPI003BAC76A8